MKYKDRKEQRQIVETMDSIFNSFFNIMNDETAERVRTAMEILRNTGIEEDNERKTGEWIKKEGWDGDIYYECSVCSEPFCLIEGTPTDNLYNYCPNCGAKMESEDKE